MDAICPKCIKLRTAKIAEIAVYCGIPVDFRPLYCAVITKCTEKDQCKECHFDSDDLCSAEKPFYGFINQDAKKIVCKEKKDFAHLYFSPNIEKATYNHYIIIFTPNSKLNDVDEICEIFLNTSKFLDIVNERLFFIAIYYGQPLFGTSISNTGAKISKKLKNNFSQYHKDEIICKIQYANPKNKILAVSDSNPLKFTLN